MINELMANERGNLINSNVVRLKFQPIKSLIIIVKIAISEPINKKAKIIATNKYKIFVQYIYFHQGLF